MSIPQNSIILGINAAYHESSAALLVGDTIVYAVEEERLSRVKHAKPALVSNPDELPWRAIRACLDAADLDGLADCHAISYSLQPGRRQVDNRNGPASDPSDRGLRDFGRRA